MTVGSPSSDSSSCLCPLGCHHLPLPSPQACCASGPPCPTGSCLCPHSNLAKTLKGPRCHPLRPCWPEQARFAAEVESGPALILCGCLGTRIVQLASKNTAWKEAMQLLPVAPSPQVLKKQLRARAPDATTSFACPPPTPSHHIPVHAPSSSPSACVSHVTPACASSDFQGAL